MILAGLGTTKQVRPVGAGEYNVGMEPGDHNQHPATRAGKGVSTRNKIGIAVGIIVIWLAISGLYVVALLLTEGDDAGEAASVVSGGAI